MRDSRALKKIRTPRQWLGRLAAAHKRSQRSIAVELQRDASQVNKWFSGREPIPHAMFLAAAAAINSRFGDEAARVWLAHEMARAISSDARRQLCEVSDETANAVATTLLTRAEASALEFGTDGEPEYEHLCRYMFDAHGLLRLVGGCQSRESAFISRNNIHDHLRFPFNVMAGDLMNQQLGIRTEQTDMRKRLSSSMRSTALGKDDDIRAIYCRQHSFHMLSRYGYPNDVSFVQELMAHATDLHTKRTSRYAEIINLEDPSAAEKFIFELGHDRRFAQVTLEFDFIHYGDKLLNGVRASNDISETVRNYLRRARHRTAPSQVCLYKLHHILFEFGPGVFQLPPIAGRVRAVLNRIYEIEPHRRTFSERQFTATFGPLVNHDKESWRQLEFKKF